MNRLFRFIKFIFFYWKQDYLVKKLIRDRSIDSRTRRELRKENYAYRIGKYCDKHSKLTNLLGEDGEWKSYHPGVSESTIIVKKLRRMKEFITPMRIIARFPTDMIVLNKNNGKKAANKEERLIEQ